MTMKGKLFLSISISAILCCNAMNWDCKDGSGSSIVKDSSPNRIDLTILQPEKVKWAREDDRGFFLQFDGGVVSCLSNDKMSFPDGMTIDIRFSVDKTKTQRDWLPLITMGNYDKNYSVWVKKSGELLVCFPGATNWYRIVKTDLKDMKDYHLVVTRGGGKVRVMLDDKLLEEYESNGKVPSVEKGMRFYLGSTYAWQFFGNIYAASVRPFEKQAEVKVAEVTVKKEDYDFEIEQWKPQGDPEGTVVICDFDKFSPKPDYTTGKEMGAWCYRHRAKFFEQAPGCLHPAGTLDVQDISYSPGLSGKYDVYLGIRLLPYEQNLYLRLLPDTKYYHFHSRPSNKIHKSVECLFARDVEMDGKSISLSPAGFFYLGYIKLIPVANRRTGKEPVFSLVSIDNEVPVDNSAEIQRKIEQQIASGYFKERHYVPAEETSAANAKSLERGFQIFPWNWTELMFPADAPSSDSGDIQLKVTAAKGEAEPFSFGVRSLKEKIDFSLEQKDSFGAGITADVYVTGYGVKRTTNYSGPSEFVRGPLYLARTSSCSAAKDESRQFWIDFHVPKNTPAGVYRSHFVLKYDKFELAIPAEVTVLPFALERAKERFGFWNDFPNSTKVEPALQTQLAFGMNTFIMHDRDMIAFDSDGLIDFKNSLLTKFAPIIMEKCPDAVALILTDELRSQLETPGLYEKNMHALTAYSNEHNWPKLFFCSADEVLSNKDKIPLFLKEIAEMRRLGLVSAQDHIWYLTTRNYQKEVEEAAPNIDIFINRFNTRKLFYAEDWEQMEARASQHGTQLWAYNSNNAVVFAQPAMMRFANGWFFRTLGKKTGGQVYWAFAYQNGSAYTDLDGTDWHYVYPPEKQHPGGPSIDLLAFREGIDDLRYIITLEKTIDDAEKKGGNVSSARQLLKSLTESFDLERFKKDSVFFDSKFDRQWADADGKRFCSGSFNVPNGWKIVQYDEARNAIIGELIRLHGMK